uniref:Uncharacterized protein n=1 Tax=Arundo donax TaxID=35708 RepID=A0A0A9BDT2_ARUDO
MFILSFYFYSCLTVSLERTLISVWYVQC